MSSRRKPSPVLTEIMSNITDEDREKTRKEMMDIAETEYTTQAYQMITRRLRISTITFITDDKYYLPEKYIVEEYKWVPLSEPCLSYNEAKEIIENEKTNIQKHFSTRFKMKITEDTIQEIFINKMNWWDDAYSVPDDNGEEFIVHYYCSPCNRYVITRDMYSNICDETGVSWNLHIDNSDMDTIGNVSVNYVDEVIQIIDIFKNY